MLIDLSKVGAARSANQYSEHVGFGNKTLMKAGCDNLAL